MSYDFRHFFCTTSILRTGVFIVILDIINSYIVHTKKGDGRANKTDPIAVGLKNELKLGYIGHTGFFIISSFNRHWDQTIVRSNPDEMFHGIQMLNINLIQSAKESRISWHYPHTPTPPPAFIFNTSICGDKWLLFKLHVKCSHNSSEINEGIYNKKRRNISWNANSLVSGSI